ncbi:hypothetical protein C9374_007426 [Naegleria lovaniensis]|uniref:Class II aldolase/adducin N-terminal domain-containing protein n=1 Tax=Naegleria lovaniensis TaxID=51637 RepID=A0AA88KGK8_NAELO|nr:uncharacterized protein C9374_007426 [Naegleria lovaniensis]KAG2379287.1 hypothetical protein C9374_007426 [Naegleria lovaniensis]
MKKLAVLVSFVESRGDGFQRACCSDPNQVEEESSIKRSESVLFKVQWKKMMNVTIDESVRNVRKEIVGSTMKTSNQNKNDDAFILGMRDVDGEFVWFEDEEMILDADLLSNLCKRSLIISQKMPQKTRPTLFAFPKYSTENVSKLLSVSHLDQYSLEEQLVRTELAACYRLFDLFGWTDTIYGHLTARVVNGDKEHFLINPFGLHYSEITASSLVKVDINGEIVDPGSTGDLFGINRAGYVIHSAVHEARDDISCVMHMHYAPCAGLSCIENGFLKTLSQTSSIIGDVAYHKSEGIAVNAEERKRLQQDLGSKKKILVLENHGVVTCGESVGEAFLSMFILAEACKIQSEAVCMNNGMPNGKMIQVDESIADKSFDIAHGFTKEGFGRKELCTYMRYLDYLFESGKTSCIPHYRT